MRPIDRYPESQALFRRAVKVIPGGIYGHLNPGLLVPPSAYPFYTAQARGARFRDVDGNEFIDYICAYGHMVTGYGAAHVEAAAENQRRPGDCTTGASPVMVELAELLVDMMPAADWAFFANNGADVTRLAIMIARDATERRKIVTIDGACHGSDSWMQAPGQYAVNRQDHRHVVRIPWNDPAAFERVLDQYPGDVAGFIATPYHTPAFADNELPAAGYWETIQALCRRHNAVLIIDDTRHGFRLDMAGSGAYFGFTPDLTCLAGAMANGYPVSALVGCEALRTTAARVFRTGGYWFQAVPMAAAKANLIEMGKINAPQIMLTLGALLFDAMVNIARSHGSDLKVTGVPSMPYLRITNDESLMLHQHWCAECTRRGAYFAPHHNWFLSTAHTDADIQQTLEIVDEAFKAVKVKFGDEFSDRQIPSESIDP